MDRGRLGLILYAVHPQEVNYFVHPLYSVRCSNLNSSAYLCSGVLSPRIETNRGKTEVAVGLFIMKDQ